MSYITGLVGQANYSAAKAGVISFTKSLAQEFGNNGVTVNAIAPGFIVTGMSSKLGEYQKQQMLKAIPMGRFGQVEEVAGLVEFMALHPASAYMTGQVVTIDGGFVLTSM